MRILKALMLPLLLILSLIGIDARQTASDPGLSSRAGEVER
jgi:hypothetical protein